MARERGSRGQGVGGVGGGALGMQTATRWCGSGCGRRRIGEALGAGAEGGGVHMGDLGGTVCRREDVGGMWTMFSGKNL